MLKRVVKKSIETMIVLPYYPSIHQDIFNLIHQVDFEAFLKETI